MTFARAAIDLAGELVRAHEGSGRGAVTVVPVLVDDLDRTMPAIVAFAELTGACILDANELDGPFALTSDLVRLASSRRGIDVGVGHTARRIDAIPPSPSGLSDFQFNPPTGGSPSPGDRMLLGVSRAAAHADLDRVGVGIIVYRESMLDLPARRAAWRLTVELFAGIPHATLRTLVVLVEGVIDVQLHCQTAFGFRYGLESGRLLKRRGADDLAASARQLASGADALTLFLGAGFSATSRLPLGNSLRDTAISRLLGIPDSTGHSSRQLAERFYDWVQDRPSLMSRSEALEDREVYLSRLTLEQVVRAEFGFSGASQTLADFKDHHDRVVTTPGPAVIDLCKVLDGRHGRRIVLVTVNFDCLIERNSSMPLRVFADDVEFSDAEAYLQRYLSGEETDVPLLKLHGTIDRTDTCVVSAEQTERGIGNAKEAALRSLLVPPCAWVYVGASMRDRDLLPLLGEPAFARVLDERWVAPYLVDTVEAFGIAREPFWAESRHRTIQDRILTESADAFFAALAGAWPTS